LLFFGAEQDHRFQTEDRAVDRGRGGHPASAFGHRLEHHRRLGDAEPGAADRLGHGDTQPAGLGHRFVEFVRPLTGTVVRKPVFVAELRADLEHRLANVELILGERKLHGLSLQPLSA
jgi:hypothetical protein